MPSYDTVSIPPTTTTTLPAVSENSAPHSEQSTLHQHSVKSLPAAEAQIVGHIQEPQQHTIHNVEETAAEHQRKKEDKSFADLELNLKSIMATGKPQSEQLVQTPIPAEEPAATTTPTTTTPSEQALSKPNRFSVSPVVVSTNGNEEAGPPSESLPPPSPKGRFFVQRANDAIVPAMPKATTPPATQTVESTPSPGAESSQYTTASESVPLSNANDQQAEYRPLNVAATPVEPMTMTTVSVMQTYSFCLCLK